jgi:hypothetical protein
MHFGHGKVKTAAIAVAIAGICNAAMRQSMLDEMKACFHS